jgi:hypothetical protein
MYFVYTLHEHVLDRYVHENVWENNMYVYIHGIYQELLLFFCTYLFVHVLYMVQTCLYIIQPCSSSFIVNSYLENANPFSEHAKPFFGEERLRTGMNCIHTMLVYRNQHFCTNQFHTRIYTLRMALAGGQLSWGISARTCLAASVSVCQWTDHAE